MKIDKCPICQSAEGAVESDEQLVYRCPDCLHLFYVHSEKEKSSDSFLHFNLLEEIGQGSNVELNHFGIIHSVKTRKLSPSSIACIIDQ